MDFIKEYFDALSTRVKSPVIGSIIVAFFVLNWRSVYYLFFADTTAAVRLGFVSNNYSQWHSIVLPILYGLSFAIALPWINFIAAYIVRKPINLHRRLQSDEAVNLRIHKLDSERRHEEAAAALAREKEQAKIDAAKRLNEAKDVNSELELELTTLREIEKNAQLPPPADKIASGLSFIEAGILSIIGNYDNGFHRSSFESTTMRAALKEAIGSIQDGRLPALTEQAIRIMSSQKLIEQDFQNQLRLTTLGFEVLDFVSKNRPTSDLEKFRVLKNIRV